MKYLRVNTCAVCGEGNSENKTRFLLAENRWQDKLTILEWNEQTASHTSVQVACCVNHAEELVVHWIATGSLNYPRENCAGEGGGAQRVRTLAVISAVHARWDRLRFIARA
jgi:hypothetical protein